MFSYHFRLNRSGVAILVDSGVLRTCTPHTYLKEWRAPNEEWFRPGFKAWSHVTDIPGNFPEDQQRD